VTRSRGPLTVAVCYTGSVGVRVLELVAARSDMELVGTLVHDPAKAGNDAGILAGIAPLGLAATTQLADIISAGPDCAIWMGKGWRPAELCTLLRAGINVYTPVGAWYLPGDPDFAVLDEACRIGGATLVGGGSIPGLVSDVLPLFLSGYVGRVQQIRAWQSNLIGDYPSAEQLHIGLGFGARVPTTPPGEEPRDQRWLRHIAQSARMIADAVGFDMGAVELTSKQFVAARCEIMLPNGLRIPEGTTAGVRWEFVARTGAGETFFTLTKEQVAVPGLGPTWRASAAEPQWRVEIDGAPSLVCEIRPVSEGGFGQTTAELNAARAVNLVPSIVAAEPGCRSILDFAAAVGRA
jgi:2,4-diaminopentanoate dehydrogenase